MKNTKLFILIFLLSCSANLSAQSYLSTHGQAIVNESSDTVILRGMGLGGWMLQEGYMLQTAGFANAQHKIRAEIEALIGEADTDVFYDAWLANHCRKADIDSLKAWGFNSVRLPMHYNLFTLPVEDEPVAGEQTWLTKGFTLTDSLISWCAQNELYVILDLHATPGGQGYDEGISDYDPTKPSLWESAANREKCVALWRRLAERYADEPWIAGYDLINEPNWNLPGGTALRAIYQDITTAIREVDDRHIIFIEGNWFANDFTGLTPPWDDNMVYSPHKYWSINDAASIQWVLDLRAQYDVPLYLGESGENSNVWFRDAIKLLEDHGIGWAWWPMKKVEAIAGPLSITKNSGYQTLLDYWNNGGTPPSANFARAALTQLTEGLRIENCVYQKDVIDAMFRQVNDDSTKPFETHTIPGLIHAVNYDMARAGIAYFDTDLATYHVSTGNYTAWNRGWAYRNDGVDIEPSADPQSNGYNVGWIELGEWMDYEIDVTENGVYDLNIRVATPNFEGRFRCAVDGSDITTLRYVPSTGGYQNWQTVTVPDVVLTTDNRKFRFISEGRDYNLSTIELVKTGETTDLATAFLSAITLDNQTIALYLNKPLAVPLPPSPANFEILVNGYPITITDAVLSTDNPRIITFMVDEILEAGQVIRMNYTGSDILATDGTILTMFNFKEVQNTVPIIHAIPGRVEAEDFFFQVGVELENTFDTGGGKNVGFLDSGDYMDYYVNVAQAGTHKVEYRTAALSEMGGIQLQLIDSEGNAQTLHSATFPSTGGWQTWTTTERTVNLPAGQQHIRVAITAPQFNFNWLEFSLIATDTESPDSFDGMTLFPNPNEGIFYIQNHSKEKSIHVDVFNLFGQNIFQNTLINTNNTTQKIDLSEFPKGHYLVRVLLENGTFRTWKVVKI